MQLQKYNSVVAGLHEYYLHVQRRSADHDYDYTLYTADMLMQFDGGVTELPEDSTLIDAPLITVAEEIMSDSGIVYTAMEPVDLTKLHEIEAANEISATPEIMPEPEPIREPYTLDEYPMPDPFVDPQQLEKAGVMEGDLLPVGRARAFALLEDDFTVYSIVDGEASMCMDAIDIDDLPQSTLFAVDREEWEHGKDFRHALEDRLAHQQEREAAFLDRPDSFAIYQLDNSDRSSSLRFMSYDEMTKQGAHPTKGMYDLVYTADLGSKSLDDIFYAFNMERPKDFGGHSLSASDIIALNQNGAVSYHYVDRFGFKDVPDFAADNPLRNAEISMEDDYNMVDGIINNGPKQPTVAELEERSKTEPISLMDLHDAIRREEAEKPAEKKPISKSKRPSVLALLKQPLPEQSGPNKTAPMKGAEMEI